MHLVLGSIYWVWGCPWPTTSFPEVTEGRTFHCQHTHTRRECMLIFINEMLHKWMPMFGNSIKLITNILVAIKISERGDVRKREREREMNGRAQGMWADEWSSTFNIVEIHSHSPPAVCVCVVITVLTCIQIPGHRRIRPMSNHRAIVAGVSYVNIRMMPIGHRGKHVQ